MRIIEIEDHSATLKALNESLQIDSSRTAIVTIDMHRGHLDHVEATLPVPPIESDRVCQNAHDLLVFARKHHIPIIHIISVFREVEVGKLNPRSAHRVLSKGAPTTDAQRRGIPHNLEGSIQTQLMPGIAREKHDYFIHNKKTLNSYHGTDLKYLLKVLQVDTVVLIGINTNTCVLCAAFESFNRGYKTVVISDCVASMYGQDLHTFALQNIARCLGWVLSAEEFKEKVRMYSKAVV